MYEIVNKKPKFMVLDVVRILKTSELAVITEVNQNDSQYSDEHQWSWALDPLDKTSRSHNAWYYMDELELVNNVFEIVAKRMQHPFSSSSFNFSLNEMRRSSLNVEGTPNELPLLPRV